MRTRVIDKDRAAGVDRFDFPAVDPSAADALRGAGQGGAHLLTAGQLEALERQVKEEARKRGHEEGLAAGRAEAGARVARLEALAAAF
jgi:flagellar biosynthesis/type III secretory pathway protein FliH